MWVIMSILGVRCILLCIPRFSYNYWNEKRFQAELLKCMPCFCVSINIQLFHHHSFEIFEFPHLFLIPYTQVMLCNVRVILLVAVTAVGLVVYKSRSLLQLINNGFVVGL